MNINPLSWSIPSGATDYAYVAYNEGEGPDDAEATLRKLAKDSHHEIVGDFISGPGWTPEQRYLFAYTKPLPEATQAVRAHVEASQGVSSD